VKKLFGGDLNKAMVKTIFSVAYKGSSDAAIEPCLTAGLVKIDVEDSLSSLV